MAEQTINPTQGLTIVANINKTALGHGILTVAKAYHEPLVQLYPVLGEPPSSKQFNVELNANNYEGQLSILTTGFSERWERAGLNIRIFLKGDARKYVAENCQIGEQLHLTLSTLKSDTFIAKIVKG